MIITMIIIIIIIKNNVREEGNTISILCISCTHDIIDKWQVDLTWRLIKLIQDVEAWKNCCDQWSMTSIWWTKKTIAPTWSSHNPHDSHTHKALKSSDFECKSNGNAVSGSQRLLLAEVKCFSVSSWTGPSGWMFFFPMKQQQKHNTYFYYIIINIIII